MKGFIRKSFKLELLVSFLMVALLPLILSSVFLIQMFRFKLDNDNRRKDMDQAASIDQKLTGAFERFEEITEAISSDPELVTALEHGEGGKNEVYETLYHVTEGVRGMARFDLYSADGVCRYSTGTGIVDTKLLTDWGILRAASDHPDEMAVMGQQDEDQILLTDQKQKAGEEVRLRAARVMQNQHGESAGFVVVSVDAAGFEAILTGTLVGQDGICIVDQFWEPVFQTGNGIQDNVAEAVRSRLFSGEGILAKYHSSRLYPMAVGDTGLSFLLISPDLFTKDITKSMYSLMLVIGVISLFVCAAAANRMSNSFTRPVKSLNRAMGRVQEGDLETRMESERIDELGQLYNRFNTMTGRLKDYMEKQVSQQKEINEIQAAMMQAQLNPHFLYNTLDTMKWVAKANHIPEIATLASKLARLLRTSISQEQFITLKEEMDLVECYAKIQEIRFQGKFSFEYDLPEDVKNCRIPKLIVQSIVENSVIHGLADCDEGRITVKASRDQGELFIEVSDDGCGISREMMEILNSRDREKLRGHLGFYNVDTIIRLHYGGQYGLRVYNTGGKGARVGILLPAEIKRS